MTGTIEVTDVSRPGSPMKMFKAVAFIERYEGMAAIGGSYGEVTEFTLTPLTAAARAAATALRAFGGNEGEHEGDAP